MSGSIKGSFASAGRKISYDLDESKQRAVCDAVIDHFIDHPSQIEATSYKDMEAAHASLQKIATDIIRFRTSKVNLIDGWYYPVILRGFPSGSNMFVAKYCADTDCFTTFVNSFTPDDVSFIGEPMTEERLFGKVEQ